MTNYAFRAQRSGSFLVIRGARWHTGDATHLVARVCRKLVSSYRDLDNGFRCVRAKFSGSDRVFRGGSWSLGAVFCRAAFRYGDDPSNRVSGFGLRLVRREE